MDNFAFLENWSRGEKERFVPSLRHSDIQRGFKWHLDSVHDVLNIDEWWGNIHLHFCILQCWTNFAICCNSDIQRVLSGTYIFTKAWSNQFTMSSILMKQYLFVLVYFIFINKDTASFNLDKDTSPNLSE